MATCKETDALNQQMLVTYSLVSSILEKVLTLLETTVISDAEAKTLMRNVIILYVWHAYVVCIMVRRSEQTLSLQTHLDIFALHVVVCCLAHLLSIMKL